MDKLLQKINNRSAKVFIIGGGYVGLPLAVRCAQESFKTTIYDISVEKVDSINAGISYIEDVSNEILKPLIESKMLWATSKEEDFTEQDVFIICVPTPLNKIKDPDISYVIKATEIVNKILSQDSRDDKSLIVLESTVYPGLTRELLQQKLVRLVDEGCFLAFSPERVDPGNKEYNIKNTAKVVGGVTINSTKVATAFYKTILDYIVPVSSSEAAEMTKILENTFRLINIGLVNETAMVCRKLGIDIWEVIQAADTKPYGFMKFTPGPGVGGHCIPIDPHYLSWKLKTLNYHLKFIELAGEINSQMPKEVVYLVADVLNQIQKSINGSKVLIVGTAYKPNISDLRESPAIDIIELLLERGAQVEFYDPFVSQIRLKNSVLYVTKNPTCMYDCLVVVTDHTGMDYQGLLQMTRSAVDTRNALKNVQNINNIPILKI